MEPILNLGFICSGLDSEECEAGHRCLADLSMQIQCEPGFYQGQSGSEQCIQCPSNACCNQYAMTASGISPQGYVCFESMAGFLRDCEPCPQGFVCQEGLLRIDTDDVDAADNIQPCPNGMWCPEGVGSFDSVYAQFSTPQQCLDSVLCAQDLSLALFTDRRGAPHQYGIDACEVGYYCQEGLPTICPSGSFCNNEGKISLFLKI